MKTFPTISVRSLAVAGVLAITACSGSATPFVNPPVQSTGSGVDVLFPHALHAVPSTLTFYATTKPSTFKIVDPGGGTVTIKSNNTKVATVTPSSGKNGTTCSVTPKAGGTTSIALADAHGHHAKVTVRVIP